MSEVAISLPVADAYDRWSAFYDSYDNPMVFAVAEAVRSLCHEIGGKDVVEFGCGTGRNLAALKAGGARRLVGCDVSDGMLQKARERDASFELFLHDMATPLAIPDQSFDLALFCLSLEHVSDLAAPLRQARQIMRRSGRIAVIEIHPFLSHGGVAAHFRDGDEIVEMPTFPHQLADYLNAFAAVGLRLSRRREWRPCDFETPAPAKALKRGAEFPLIIEFSLTR